MDGDHWYLVEPADDGWTVASNAPRERFESLFRLDAEWNDALPELARLGPELRPLLAANPGLRLTRPSDPVETLFSFLCTPNNHVPRITKMVEHLASYGPILPEMGARRFPSVETLARIVEADLRDRGFGYRAATIPRVAQILDERGGDAYVRQLAMDPNARTVVLSLPGVGPKLADCILLFAFGRGESVPVDTHVWQAITRRYFTEWQGASLTPARYQAAAERLQSQFGRLAGWAQQYLFFDNFLHWRARRGENH